MRSHRRRAIPKSGATANDTVSQQSRARPTSSSTLEFFPSGGDANRLPAQRRRSRPRSLALLAMQQERARGPADQLPLAVSSGGLGVGHLASHADHAALDAEGVARLGHAHGLG